MGEAYLRYSFTKGTVQEVGFLVAALGLRPGMRVLDVGCGPGRHSHELARRGLEVVGVDIAQRFVDLANAAAPAGASFIRADARALRFEEEFDAAVSLCQGGIGLGDGDPIAGDLEVLRGIRRALRPGGRVALSAFNAYFQVRWLEDHDSFDAATGVNHEPTEVRDETGVAHPADLWTTCCTPRELQLLFRVAGLSVDEIFGVEPGRYGSDPPSIDRPELLVLGARAALA
ncbi:MAG: methyltransferase domain-containing protein [Microthrixaceae bacterium]|nr:methyltransferase domain-containing protein [Microthrixaceae bacterium]